MLYCASAELDFGDTIDTAATAMDTYLDSRNSLYLVHSQRENVSKQMWNKSEFGRRTLMRFLKC